MHRLYQFLWRPQPHQWLLRPIRVRLDRAAAPHEAEVEVEVEAEGVAAAVAVAVLAATPHHARTADTAVDTLLVTVDRRVGVTARVVVVLAALAAAAAAALAAGRIRSRLAAATIRVTILPVDDTAEAEVQADDDTRAAEREGRGSSNCNRPWQLHRHRSQPSTVDRRWLSRANSGSHHHVNTVDTMINVTTPLISIAVMILSLVVHRRRLSIVLLPCCHTCCHPQRVNTRMSSSS